MAERTWWESIRAESGNVIDRLKAVIHEGNVRRVVVRQTRNRNRKRVPESAMEGETAGRR